ncbi:hypothetical protein MRI28_13965 [Nocardiopsis dassonvillei]|uniref:hypothetical protein n=1 Tax=Nocardiopsis dassonvillei TaxID=2014 RepID=UPI0020105F57|nr:hypothetical protein [Nocardiopsis dassonvillei]MCK9870728.1 hypothetical protein [Nocardiopsis dassonvillei]
MNGHAVNAVPANGAPVNGAPVNGAARHGTPLYGSPEEGARPAPSPLRRIADFPQPVRFLAIAVTATLWDARVAFVTLVVGCVVAATAQLADPARSRR